MRISRVGRSVDRWWFFTLSRWKETLPLWCMRGGLVLVALAIFLGGWYLDRDLEGFSVGQPAPRTFLAVFRMRFEDVETTEKLKLRIADRVVGVVVQDPSRVEDILVKIDQLQENRAALLPVLSAPLVEIVERLPEGERTLVLREARRLGEMLLEKGMLGVGRRAPELWEVLDDTSLSWSQKNVAFQLLDQILLYAQYDDRRLTAAVERQLQDSVQPVVRTLDVGQVIVEQGDVVTPFLGSLLRSQGFPEALFPWGSLLLVMAASFLWGLWLTSFPIREKALEDRGSLIFVTLLLAVSWGVEVGTTYFRMAGMGTLVLAGWAFLALPPFFAFQLVLGGGALGVLISESGGLAHISLGLMVVSVVSGTGFLLFRQVRSRVHLWREIIVLGLVTSGVALLAWWGSGAQITATLVLRFLSASAILGALVVAVLPLWENVFDILSPLRLLELSHHASPLLKRLQIEAPGTYHHVLMVGTLAERAADRLGMNSLLVQAGAYYHDIGKLKRPQFFVENQMSGVNVHDDLSPSLSALVIIAHVRDGMEIAAEARLPKRLRQFIQEHHGTTHLSYFFRKALAQGERVDREQFCYPGPCPRSRETAVVMLADSVEAAVRAAWGAPSRETPGGDNPRTPEGKGPSRQDAIQRPAAIQSIVQGVVETKMREGQLSHVDLSLKDIALMEKTFVETLQFMYHSRQTKDDVGPKAPEGR